MDEDRKRSMQGDRAALESELRALGAVFRGRRVKCPFHDDRTASGEVRLGSDGIWRYYCYAAGCGFKGDIFDVRSKATGRPVADLIRELCGGRGRGREYDYATAAELVAAIQRHHTVTNVYTYQRNGEIGAYALVIRCAEPGGRKTFLQASRVNGRYRLQAPPQPWPLYRLNRVMESGSIIVVEGEKCADALQRILPPDWAATTSMAGAGKAGCTDWTPLAGRRVYLWPDYDPPDPKTEARTGYVHMDDVAERLESLRPPAQIYWLDPEMMGLKEKGDAADFVSAGGTWEQLTIYLKECVEARGDAARLENHVEDIISGEWSSYDWPWSHVSESARCMYPGTITLLCGAPDARKSFMTMRAAMHWHQAGIPIAMALLEEPKRYHQMRALAMLAGNGDILDAQWARQHAAEFRAAYQTHRAAVESLSARMWCWPTAEITFRGLLRWMEERAAEGTKIIIIDPITAASVGNDRWIEDRNFMFGALNLVGRAGIRLLLVTHPRRGAKEGTLDEIAGGAAYPRHAQTVLLLSRVDPAVEKTVRTEFGPTTAKINAELKILKARHGMGHGRVIGMFFDGTLEFRQRGLVLPKPRRSTVYADGEII